MAQTTERTVRSISFRPEHEAAIEAIQATLSVGPRKPVTATEAIQLAVLGYAEHLVIQAKKKSDRGQRAQVSQSRLLARSHELVWCGDEAEIRDQATARVVFSGTYTEAVVHAKRIGLWY